MSDSQNSTPPPPSAPPPPPSAPPPPASPPPGGQSAGPGGPSSDGPKLPWLERKELGFVNAFVETAKLIVQRPADAYSRIRADGDYVSPLLFGGVIFMAALLVLLVFGLFWGMLFSGSSGLGALAIAGELGMIMTAVALVVAPFCIVIGLFLTSGIFHGILSLTGGLNNSRTGFEGSFQVAAYSALASVVLVIPVIGPILYLGAFGYLCFIGLQQAHRCTEKQALFALIPLIVCGGCGVFFSIADMFMSMF